MYHEPNQIQIFGTGAYTVADAGRLSGVPGQRIRRWLQGRSREYKGNTVRDEPLWEPELPTFDGGLYLGFRDLIELRMVDAFRNQRISLPYLRKVVEAAREIIGDDHPFSTSNFKTDGHRLYLEVLTRTDEPKLIEVLSGQHAFHSIISLGLKDIHFEGGIASKWIPASGKGEVTLDPRRSFGAPILDRYGISTATIKFASEQGRTARQISDDFEIDLRSVRAALAFENAIAA